MIDNTAYEIDRNPVCQTFELAGQVGVVKLTCPGWRSTQYLSKGAVLRANDPVFQGFADPPFRGEQDDFRQSAAVAASPGLPASADVHSFDSAPLTAACASGPAAIATTHQVSNKVPMARTTPAFAGTTE